jgi:two-component system phosphate regulon sensor histidine kinase PhoR
MAVLVVSVGGLIVAADRWLRSDLEDAFASELEHQARLAALAVPPSAPDLNVVAHHLGDVLKRRVTLIGTDGTVLGDSDFDDASMRVLENHLMRPEVQEAFQHGVGVDRRRSASTKRDEMKVAIAAWPGIVRISAPLVQVDDLVGGAQRTVWLAGLAALLVGAILAAVTGEALARPLRELAVASQALGADRTPDYPSSSIREVRRLVQAFGAMQEELGARMAELQRGRDHTETLVQSMVEGVAATDADGNVVSANSALRAMFAFEPGDRIPNLRELFRAPDARGIVDGVLNGAAVLGREITIEGRSAVVTARPLPTGGAVFCVHDVSALRRLEAVRRDFVANVSHELKTPLTSISGYAETLLADNPDAETRRQFLQTIAANARRMQALVDDLLDLAKLESGHYQPHVQELDARQAADIAWSAVASQAAERNVAYVVSIRPDQKIDADPDAVRQILTNLFENAVRYTPAGGRVEVAARPVDHATEVTVRDTGTGIPTEHLPRIFERFYRVDSHRARDHGGTGLGLSIVKHLVEAHDGTIEVESALGQGTTFRMRFPAEPAARKAV